MKIKSLTLTVEEIAQLIHLTDFEERRQVMNTLIEGAKEPDRQVDEQTMADSHPMAIRIAQKIQRKAEAIRKRRARRQERATRAREAVENDERIREQKSEPKEADIMAPIEFRNDDVVTLELNKATVGRLLWLKQNHRTWCHSIQAIISSLVGSDIPSKIVSQIMYLIERLFRYFSPLISQAADYHHTPRHLRPRFATT